jgi:pimeloyl-ACP methyl ester carboxylesterase
MRSESPDSTGFDPDGKAAVILVHGFLSSEDVWRTLKNHLNEDNEIRRSVDIHTFAYPSAALSPKPGTRIPDIATIARSFKTFIDAKIPKGQPCSIICHSEGGLIVQRYLAQEVTENRGTDLHRVQNVTLLACPNAGSRFLLSLRKLAGFWQHPQERELRPLVESVTATQRIVFERIVFAQGVSEGYCHIPIFAYAGESDNIVVPASARALFPQGGVLPGDHSSIIHPPSRDSVVYGVLRARILEAIEVATDSTNVSKVPPTANVKISDRVFASGSSMPEQRTTGMTTLKNITDALLMIDEFADDQSRRQLTLFMPPHIRESMNTSGSSRIQVISLIRTCMRFENAGRAALMELLDAAIAKGDPSVWRAREVIDTYWPPTHPGQDHGRRGTMSTLPSDRISLDQ